MIEEVLRYLGTYSEDAVELLMMTAAQETHCGEYIFQLVDGPARGIFQMEPSTEDDIWKNFLRYQERMQEKIGSLMRDVPSDYQGGEADSPDTKRLFRNYNLKYNLAYQIAMARMQYYRHSEPLPDSSDVAAMARYYKKYYNTSAGKATISEAMTNYLKYAQT